MEEATNSNSKRLRLAMSNEEEDAATSSAAAAGAEHEDGEQVGSAETEEHVQRILVAIDNFTRQVAEMLETGRALFKDLAADFEDRLCSIHKERVERWEEEIRELRARDAANEQARAILHHAQLHLLSTVPPQQEQ